MAKVSKPLHWLLRNTTFRTQWLCDHLNSVQEEDLYRPLIGEHIHSHYREALVFITKCFDFKALNERFNLGINKAHISAIINKVVSNIHRGLEVGHQPRLCLMFEYFYMQLNRIIRELSNEKLMSVADERINGSRVKAKDAFNRRKENLSTPKSVLVKKEQTINKPVFSPTPKTGDSSDSKSDDAIPAPTRTEAVASILSLVGGEGVTYAKVKREHLLFCINLFKEDFRDSKDLSKGQLWEQAIKLWITNGE